LGLKICTLLKLCLFSCNFAPCRHFCPSFSCPSFSVNPIRHVNETGIRVIRPIQRSIGEQTSGTAVGSRASFFHNYQQRRLKILNTSFSQRRKKIVFTVYRNDWVVSTGRCKFIRRNVTGVVSCTEECSVIGVAGDGYVVFVFLCFPCVLCRNFVYCDCILHCLCFTRNRLCCFMRNKLTMSMIHIMAWSPERDTAGAA